MEEQANTMWSDDTDFPSVPDKRNDIEIPDEDREWAEWWQTHTCCLKALRYWQAYGGRESKHFNREAA
jgi:hypothetical protein